MTFEEQQELTILSSISDTKVSPLPLHKFQLLFSNLCGNSWDFIYNQFQKKGFIGWHEIVDDKLKTSTGGVVYKKVYGITDLGITRKESLLKIRDRERIGKGVSIITLISAIAGALYAGLTYHGCNLIKPSSNDTLNQIQEVKISPPSMVKPSETKKVHVYNILDTAAKTNEIDTTK